LSVDREAAAADFSRHIRADRRRARRPVARHLGPLARRVQTSLRTSEFWTPTARDWDHFGCCLSVDSEQEMRRVRSEKMRGARATGLESRVFLGNSSMPSTLEGDRANGLAVLAGEGLRVVSGCGQAHRQHLQVRRLDEGGRRPRGESRGELEQGQTLRAKKRLGL